MCWMNLLVLQAQLDTPPHSLASTLQPMSMNLRAPNYEPDTNEHIPDSEKIREPDPPASDPIPDPSPDEGNDPTGPIRA